MRVSWPDGSFASPGAFKRLQAVAPRDLTRVVRPPGGPHGHCVAEADRPSPRVAAPGYGAAWGRGRFGAASGEGLLIAALAAEVTGDQGRGD